MLTFDDEDNDDNLNLDNSGSKPLPKKTAAPFGQGNSSTGGAVPPAQKPAFKLPPKRPTTTPFTPGAASATSQTGFPSKPLPSKPAPVDLPPTLPPAQPVEEPAVEEQPQQSELAVPEGTSREAKAYLQALMDPRLNPPTTHQTPLSQEQPRVPQTTELPPQLNYDSLGFNNPQQPALQQPPVFEEEPSKKSKWGGKGKKNSSKPAKNQGKPSKAKTERENKYQGERKKVLYVRLGVGALAVIIGLAGLKAIILPDTGLSPEEVQAVAMEAVNYTGFPSASGEQFAIDFARTYFDYSSDDTSRKDKLMRFASEELADSIEIQIMSAEEYEQLRVEDGSGQSVDYTDYVESQEITYGPYVVAIDNISEEHAVFTVKVGLDSGAVLYMDVPVKYDPDQYSLTLAGPPSFVKPNQNVGKTTPEEYTAGFSNQGGDEEVQKEFQPDLEAFLSAWALSDETIINRYTLDNATDNAKRGLQGQVEFHSILDFAVEPYDEARPNTANARRAEFTVLWEDPETNLRYPQQYRLLLGLNQDGNWSIYDIENFAVLN